MKKLENWLVNLTGEQYLWVLELFVIVVLALSLGLLINRVIDKLEVQAAKTQTVWDDALPATADLASVDSRNQFCSRYCRAKNELWLL